MTTLPRIPEMPLRKFLQEYRKRGSASKRNIREEFIAQVFEVHIRLDRWDSVGVYKTLYKNRDNIDPGELILTGWGVVLDGTEDVRWRSYMQVQFDVQFLWFVTRQHMDESLWRLWRETAALLNAFSWDHTNIGDVVWYAHNDTTNDSFTALDTERETLWSPAIVLKKTNKPVEQLLVKSIFNNHNVKVNENRVRHTTELYRAIMRNIDRPEIRKLGKDIQGWIGGHNNLRGNIRQSAAVANSPRSPNDMWLWARYTLWVPDVHRTFVPILDTSLTTKSVTTLSHSYLAGPLKIICDEQDAGNRPRIGPTWKQMVNLQCSQSDRAHTWDWNYINDTNLTSYIGILDVLSPYPTLDTQAPQFYTCDSLLVSPANARPMPSYDAWLEALKTRQKRAKETKNEAERKEVALMLQDPQHTWGWECLKQKLWTTRQVREAMEKPFRLIHETANEFRRQLIKDGDLIMPDSGTPQAPPELYTLPEYADTKPATSEETEYTPVAEVAALPAPSLPGQVPAQQEQVGAQMYYPPQQQQQAMYYASQQPMYYQQQQQPMYYQQQPMYYAAQQPTYLQPQQPTPTYNQPIYEQAPTAVTVQGASESRSSGQWTRGPRGGMYRIDRHSGRKVYRKRT